MARLKHVGLRARGGRVAGLRFLSVFGFMCFICFSKAFFSFLNLFWFLGFGLAPRIQDVTGLRFAVLGRKRIR